jgi:DNA-binding response OmpR family regulator
MQPRVLLVDDDNDIAQGIRLRLNATGYDCTIAADGYAGLQSAMADPPTVILLDIRMPKLDGITLLRELKQIPATSSIPVIVVSASLVEQNNALDAGARFFLTKPYDGAHLLQTIRYALDEAAVANIPARELRSTYT